MTDKPNLIEQVTATFMKQAEIAHDMGLTYWEVHRILLGINLGLCFKADNEFYLNRAEEKR